MDKVFLFEKATFSSLSIRNYRLYFIGQAISLTGTWMQTIAQSWLVLKLTGSGTALGVVTALQFLPILILAPLGGILADRFRKQHILYITQSCSGILAFILGILVLTNTIQLWMLYTLALCLGLVNTFDNPTRQTFVIEMVGKEYLKNAVSLNSTEVNLARVIGPVIAGLLIATVGIGPCFIINAFSYIAVLVGLYKMDINDLVTSPPVDKIKGQLAEGLAYVRKTPIILNTLVIMGVIGTLSYEFNVILPLLAQRTFHGGAATYSLLTASLGVGSVIGGLITASLKETTTKAFTISAFFFGVCILATSLSPTLPIAMFMLVLVGVFSLSFIALGNTILQTESEPQMRGRVMALWAMAFLGSTPIGGPIIGWIGEHIGARWGLTVGGVAAVAAAGYSMSLQMKERMYRLKTSFLSESIAELATEKVTTRE